MFVYLIVRGHKMADRDAADAKAQDEAARAYIREAANGNGTADDLAKLADLRDRGVISEADFQENQARARARLAAWWDALPGPADRAPADDRPAIDRVA